MKRIPTWMHISFDPLKLSYRPRPKNNKQKADKDWEIVDDLLKCEQTPSSKVCCSTASKWMVMSETRRIADYTRRYKTKRTVVTCLSLFFFYYFFLLFLFSLYFLMYSIWPAMASSFRHETAQWQPTQAKASISCKHFLFLSTLSFVSIFIFGLSIRFERGAGRRSVGRAPCLFQIVGLKGKVTHTQ